MDQNFATLHLVVLFIICVEQSRGLNREWWNSYTLNRIENPEEIKGESIILPLYGQ